VPLHLFQLFVQGLPGELERRVLGVRSEDRSWLVAGIDAMGLSDR
jgi:hypothetical protein